MLNILPPHLRNYFATKIGIALANLGFEQVRTSKGRFWKVADRPEKEIDSLLPGDEPEPLPF